MSKALPLEALAWSAAAEGRVLCEAHYASVPEVVVAVAASAPAPGSSSSSASLSSAAGALLAGSSASAPELPLLHRHLAHYPPHLAHYQPAALDGGGPTALATAEKLRLMSDGDSMAWLHSRLPARQILP